MCNVGQRSDSRNNNDGFVTVIISISRKQNHFLSDSVNDRSKAAQQVRALDWWDSSRQKECFFAQAFSV